MAKVLTFSEEARQMVRAGASKLARAVRTTLGPHGRPAILDRSYGTPTITKDGVTVAEEIELVDPREDAGARLIREVAKKTSDKAGDGTTTATILADEMIGESLKNVTAGANATAIARGIHAAAAIAVESLKKMSRPVKGAADIARVGRIAANGDEGVGSLLSEAMEKVGEDGVITVEEGKTAKTEVKLVEGMQFNRGYVSPYFINTESDMSCTFENPLILLHEDKITSNTKLVKFLEKVIKTKRPLLIIAETVEGEALATLVVNALKKIVPCCAVKAPGFGDRRKEMLRDIAVLIGGEVFFKDTGSDLELAELAALGTAKKVIISKENTTITEGGGKRADLTDRIAQIRRDIEKTTSDYDREKLEERLAKLAGGVATIQVGAATDTAMKEKKDLIDDALNATRAAVAEGIVPGGGVALLRAADAIDLSKFKGEERAGARIVKKALAAPLVQIAVNAGEEGGVVLKKVAEGKGAFGYDAEHGEYCDVVKAGIVDPVKVSRSAVEFAASIAVTLLGAECLVTNKVLTPDEMKDAAEKSPAQSDEWDSEPLNI